LRLTARGNARATRNKLRSGNASPSSAALGALPPGEMTIFSSRGQACAPRQISRQTGSLGLVDGHVARGGVLSNVVEMPVSGGAFTNSEIADALAKAPESLEVDAPKPTPSPSRMRPRTRPGTRFREVLDDHLTAQCLTVSADMVYDPSSAATCPGGRWVAHGSSPTRRCSGGWRRRPRRVRQPHRTPRSPAPLPLSA